MPSKSEPLSQPPHSSVENDMEIKQEAKYDDAENSDYEYNSDGDKNEQDRQYPMDLPLEVITTIEPFNFAYPVLKNMSNGVLTHRNIFTEVEREVLRKIVEKYREIVDTRSRTREIYLEKQNVWQHIVEEYNSTDNIMVRTEKELRKCWDNMKYRARQAVKEQQIKAELVNESKSPDSHLFACNAVQAALEKMLHAQNPPSLNSSKNEKNGELPLESKEQMNLYSENRSSSNSDEDKDSPPNDQGEASYEEDEYDQPLFKKARQESPKLSSLLLGDDKRNSSKSELNGNVSHYTIPHCTKVTHIKKKSKKSGHNPVTILPKGLNSCVSIMNIPNPNQPESSNNFSLEGTLNDSEISGTINLGGGVTISAQKSSSSLPSQSAEMDAALKPMPNLKKMTYPKKNNFKKTPFKHLNSNDAANNQHASSNSHSSGYGLDSDIDKELELKIFSQRLEFEEKEHLLKMKVLEKQLQASSNESQYWSLKLKLLQNGQDVSFGRGIINGDFHLNS